MRQPPFLVRVPRFAIECPALIRARRPKADLDIRKRAERADLGPRPAWSSGIRTRSQPFPAEQPPCTARQAGRMQR
eukprot:3233042-Rhodomonas_salina.1